MDPRTLPSGIFIDEMGQEDVCQRIEWIAPTVLRDVVSGKGALEFVCEIPDAALGLAALASRSTSQIMKQLSKQQSEKSYRSNTKSYSTAR